MRILITGSRDWDVPSVMAQALLSAIPPRTALSTVVVHGGAKGADTLAGVMARVLSAQVEVHPADWTQHGKAAGPIRNKHMVSLGADLCLAFIKNDSRGATHCAELAEKAGIPVKYFRIDDKESD